jgi:hypothetical protein
VVAISPTTKRSHEGREPMAHPAVNHIFQEGPAQQARDKQSGDANRM